MEMASCKEVIEPKPKTLKSQQKTTPKKNSSKKIDLRPSKSRPTSSQESQHEISASDDNGTWSDIQRQGQTMLFKCPMCHCLTSERLKMTRHISLRHVDSIVIGETDPVVVIVDQENLHSCKDCHLMYGEREAALICQLTHVGIEVETCNICLDTFPTKTALLHHLLGFHHTMFCQLCQKGFHTYDGMVTHCQLHVHEKLIPRDANGKMVIEIGIHNGKTFLFPNENELNAEKFCISSKIPPAVIADSRLFYCILCQQNIEGELTHIVHMKTHESNRPLSCLKCQEQFHTEADLKQHYKLNKYCTVNKITYDTRVLGRPDCICFVCLLVFEDRKSLDKHQFEHIRQQNPMLMKKSLKVMHSLKCFLDKVPNVVETKQNIEWHNDLKSADQNYGLQNLMLEVHANGLEEKHPSHHNWSCCQKNVGDKTTTTLNCPFCTLPHKHLEKHIGSHFDVHNPTQIRCCNSVFNTYEEQSIHVESVHKPKDDVRYFCPYCLVPVGLSHLKNHHYGISFHSNKIRCSYCYMLFNRNEFKHHLADRNPNANLNKVCGCPSYKMPRQIATSPTKKTKTTKALVKSFNQFNKKENPKKGGKGKTLQQLSLSTPSVFTAPRKNVSEDVIQGASSATFDDGGDDFTSKMPGTIMLISIFYSFIPGFTWLNYPKQFELISPLISIAHEIFHQFQFCITL